MQSARGPVVAAEGSSTPNGTDHPPIVARAVAILHCEGLSTLNAPSPTPVGATASLASYEALFLNAARSSQWLAPHFANAGPIDPFDRWLTTWRMRYRPDWTPRRMREAEWRRMNEAMSYTDDQGIEHDGTSDTDPDMPGLITPSSQRSSSTHCPTESSLEESEESDQEEQ